MPSLQTLPPELLTHILTFLPTLNPHLPQTHIVGPSTLLTPPITRVCHALRHAALPLYAANHNFSIQTDGTGAREGGGGNRVQAWLDALGEGGVRKVRSVQLSRHWELPRPERGCGHVGFYVRVQFGGEEGIEGAGKAPPERRRGGMWRVAAGTYPVANDMRGMRLESVDLLRGVVQRRLRALEGGGLGRRDVEFVVRAMEVVARHPISTFDMELSEQSRLARRRVWVEMEAELLRLGKKKEGGGVRTRVEDGEDDWSTTEETESKFFTPY